ncbi:T9SS type A sorting domain-containing protein [Aurantibacillus circumpalustris]|uniref:T9SS type A sorting domain-containing protein n=1 Tax=Aurantibacillus circumpalustris TaxID=3036359 RepID=UPI00295A57C8|nr:T9SS type A sorting domain-containing protein [Aurantibacillus circumpalustris]
MKKHFLIATLIFLFFTHKNNAQPDVFNIKPASCYTCCDGSFTMTVASCNPFSFNWGIIPKTYIYAGWNGNTFFFDNVCVGTYSIYVTGVADSCQSHNSNITIPFSTTGIFETSSDSKEFLSYPNPTDGSLNLNFSIDFFSSKKISIRILNVAGAEMLNKIITESDINLDLTAFGNGIYFLEVLNDEKLLMTRKIIKN